MSKLEVILCESLENSLAEAIEKCPHDRLFILTDEHTHRLCLPQLQNIPAIQDATEIIIGAEDVHKNLETLASVWQALSEQGATRHSLLINLGGGMVTDLGGFCRRHLQAWNSVYQYPHYPTFHGRRLSRRKNRHKLQWTEK